MGGVQTNSYSQLSNNQEDNLAFTVNYQNISSADHLFAIFADSTKTASRTVAAFTSGDWQTRTNWPVSGSHRFFTMYDDSSTGGWDQSFQGGLHSVNSAIRVVNVRLWNSTVGGSTTNATAAQLQTLLDNNTITYAWQSTQSVDAIHTQCGNTSAEYPERMQFRFVGMGSSTLNLTNCTLNENCQVSSGCRDQAFNATTNNGTNMNELHIISVPSLAGSFVGCRSYAGGGNPSYAIMISNGMWTQSAIPAEVAHEIGHTFYGHGGTTCNGCSANNSLMCPNLGNCGRFIPNDSTGCDRHASSTFWEPTAGAYLKDAN